MKYFQETTTNKHTQEKTDWFAWFWRLLGGTIIGALLVLIVTIFNHVNDRVTSCERDLSESKAALSAAVGELKGDVVSVKQFYDKMDQRLAKLSASYKEADKDMLRSIQEAREKVAAMEEKIKAMGEKLSDKKEAKK